MEVEKMMESECLLRYLYGMVVVVMMYVCRMMGYDFILFIS